MLKKRSGKNIPAYQECYPGGQPEYSLQHPLPGYDLQALQQAARSVQDQMRARSGCGRFPFVPGHIATIAGADAPYRGWFGTGVVIVLTFPDLPPLCHAYANRVTTFPYLPGLFGFRELPVIMAAFEKLPCLPDILLLDGHGYAHPRRFGYACQAGVALGIPTIGVAKRPLIGKYTLPGHIRGSTSEVIDDGEVIGIAVKTQTGVRPVYVSAGYRTDIDGAVRITHAAGGRHRIPEPLRIADILARRYRDHFFPK